MLIYTLLPTKNIIGIRRTNNAKEFAKIYTAANVFLNPPLEDNYPTVNLEAQACGTFTITFDSGGACETIVNEQTGICLRNESHKSILETIKFIRSSDALCNKKFLTENELGKMSKEIAVGGYMLLYSNLVHNSKKMSQTSGRTESKGSSSLLKE